MNAKMILLLLLGFSFLFMGCAKKDGAAPAEQPPAEAPPEEGEPGVEVSIEEQERVADLFQVETDKPLEDEGLDIGTPSSD